MVDAAPAADAATHYPFVELLREALSPAALGVLTQLAPRVREIYGLERLFDEPLPSAARPQHYERLTTRIQRVTSLLPADVSPTANEVFSALEFLVYEIHAQPIVIGEALTRLQILADEIRARPLLNDLVAGRAN
jgi:hypothetical protein